MFERKADEKIRSRLSFAGSSSSSPTSCCCSELSKRTCFLMTIFSCAIACATRPLDICKKLLLLPMTSKALSTELADCVRS